MALRRKRVSGVSPWKPAKFGPSRRLCGRKKPKSDPRTATGRPFGGEVAADPGTETETEIET